MLYDILLKNFSAFLLSTALYLVYLCRVDCLFLFPLIGAAKVQIVFLICKKFFLFFSCWMTPFLLLFLSPARRLRSPRSSTINSAFPSFSLLSVPHSLRLRSAKVVFFFSLPKLFCNCG
jgi:hypothetical protein